MPIFIPFAVFSIFLVLLFIFKRTFVAQFLSPGYHAPSRLSEPFGSFPNLITVEKFEDMRTWMAPY